MEFMWSSATRFRGIYVWKTVNKYTGVLHCSSNCYSAIREGQHGGTHDDGIVGTLRIWNQMPRMLVVWVSFD